MSKPLNKVSHSLNEALRSARARGDRKAEQNLLRIHAIRNTHLKKGLIEPVRIVLPEI